ncbi:uncharacterized protein UBRO_20221 [Ustilago bromivora]|uniref:Uncharacterized protein n=1 Tax=Ustilago bromivora TaxID=307758 RepID=A0A1K0H4B1_9BASI|nr:uncharacterized protein UBRO_20221 [Ustilago bromivora]
MHAQRVMAAILGSTPLPLLSLPRPSLITIARRTSTFWKLSLSLKPYNSSSLIGQVPPLSWCMLTTRTLSMASARDAPMTYSPNVSCRKSLASASSTTSQSSHTLPPAPAAMPGVHPCPSSPSASDISGSAHPVFQPQASNCWSGLPTSPALVALSTRPSTGSVPSNPTMWTLASTPQVSPAAASSTPCVVTSACMVLPTQALSFPSPCHSSARSSSPWERWPTSSPKTASSFRQPLPLPLPASSAQVSWSGTTAPTVPPSSQSPPSSGHLTMLCSPSPPPRPTLSGRVCMSSPQKWVALSAWLLVSSTSPTVAHLQHHSSALALPASTLSPGLPSSPSSAMPSRIAASQCRSTPATWVSQHSASTADIQSLGRWSSDCHHHYIDRSAQECRALVASALFSIHNGPLVPSGPAWRDPGLA